MRRNWFQNVGIWASCHAANPVDGNRRHNGEVDVKTACVPGVASFAIKMSSGFFDNPSVGLPSTSGLMAVFSAQTGLLETLLLDNAY